MTLKHAAMALSLALPLPAIAGSYTQTNLTSDGAISANFIDKNLKNPWGISYSPSGPFWVSDNNSGLTTLYNTSGQPQSLVVTIPSVAGGSTLGSPTGQVFNASSSAFTVTQSGKSGAAAFLFATEDGTISGWAPSVNATTAVVAVDMSKQGAVFKGLALNGAGTSTPTLLAADLHGGVVDVFDSTFKLTASFRDSTLESVYAPFNVAVLNGNIYVAYAWVNAARNDVIPHPGWGVVEQVDSTGKVLAKSAGGPLNAPWGLAIAPASFGKFKNDLLVGNFGNGYINAFTPALAHAGVLKTSAHKPIKIDGLWGLIVGNGGSGGDSSDIYFTAGPNKEADGLFGSLSFTR